jgi:hypothetical protein
MQAGPDPSPAPPSSQIERSRSGTERGSAFRGMNRGRGGRGGRRGLGEGRGRGTRGSGAPRRGNAAADPSSQSKLVTLASPPAVKTGPSVPQRSMSGSSAAATTPPKHKAPSKPNARNTPALVVASSSPKAEKVDVSQSTNTKAPRGTNRRRRSQLHTQPPAVPPLSLSPNQAPARTQRSRSGPPTPIKNQPPNFSAAPQVSTFDMRRHIDDLVEHVRAVAMDNRPTTPGSHIDWAGDEDDSLPDLHDWGVTTGANTDARSEIISPIIVDGLKPLPEAVAIISSPSVVCTEPANLTMPATVAPDVNNAQGTRSQAWRMSSSRPNLSSSRPDKGKQRTKGRPPPPGLAQLSADGQAPDPTPGKEKSRPVQSFAAQPEQPSRFPDQHHSPAGLHGSSKGTESPVANSAPAQSVPTLTVGVAQRDDVVQPAGFPVGLDTGSNKGHPDLESLPGLEASIHAPKDSASKVSSLSPRQPEISISVVDPSVSTPPPLARPGWPSSRGLNSFHRRSHTIGRHPNHEPPDTTYHFKQTPRRVDARHDDSAPPHGDHHPRTHSTPPPGSPYRPAQSHRPVITGDAISRLARTINNSSIKSQPSAPVKQSG